MSNTTTTITVEVWDDIGVHIIGTITAPTIEAAIDQWRTDHPAAEVTIYGDETGTPAGVHASTLGTTAGRRGRKVTHMSNTHTCTVITDATGGRCGQPAVVSFTTRRGETFHECAEHGHDLGADPAAPVVGGTVTVRHCGITKAAVVEHIGRTRITVSVPLADGRTKSITRPINEVVAL